MILQAVDHALDLNHQIEIMDLRVDLRLQDKTLVIVIPQDRHGVRMSAVTNRRRGLGRGDCESEFPIAPWG